MEVTNTDLMMSLYDYLGKAAGSDLGKAVAKTATMEKVPITRREVTTRNYSGEILMYPKSFLDKYFKK
jgi:hypothetical protein